MPKYEYDEESYENEFTFEPNRSRRKRRFYQEREQVAPIRKERKNLPKDK